MDGQLNQYKSHTIHTYYTISNSPICGNEQIELNATVAGAVSTYSWIGPNGFTSSLEDPIILPSDPNYPSPGTYIYTLIVMDVNGCTSQETVTVVITSGPEITSTYVTSSFTDGSDPIEVRAPMVASKDNDDENDFGQQWEYLEDLKVTFAPNNEKIIFHARV